MKTSHKQRGMAALTMIMVIVILLAVIGTIIAASRTSANSTGDQQNKLFASAIIDQGNTLRNGAILMVSKGQTTLDLMTMDTDATNGLLGTNGGTIKQTPPAEAITGAITATNGTWAYFKGGANLKGLTVTDVTGGAAGSTYGFAMNGIKKTVCDQINKLHYGSTFALSPETATAITWATSGTTGISTAILDVGGTSGTAPAGWNFGCVMNTGSTTNGIYFNVVQP